MINTDYLRNIFQGYFAPGNSKVSNQSAKLLDSILNTKIEY